MNEKKGIKRKWVIKCAVVFFVVLLILTFFSNTIMNYSLPQVATKTIESGKIANKIRGSGVVSIANPYQVTVNSERKVKLVAVKEGDVVSEGALLVMFEDDESSDVQTAKKALEDAKSSYQKYIVTNQVSDELVARVESGQSNDYSAYNERLKNAAASVASAKQQVDAYTESTKALQSQLDILQNTAVDTSAETAALKQAQADLKSAESALSIAQNNASSLEEQYTLIMESGGDALALAQRLAQAKSELNAAQNRQVQCQSAVDAANDALSAKQENKENQAAISALQLQLAQENNLLNSATDAQTKAQDAQQKILDQMNAEAELVSLYQAISQAQSDLDKLNTNGSGNKITAASSGVVSSISIAKGQTTVSGEPMMTIASTENGYSATISVTTDQARRIKVGDTVDIEESWYYNNVSGQVQTIRNNSENPSQSKLVDIKITGDVPEGTTLNFAIGDNSKTYDMIVPNGAIREDNNAKFILIIRQKSSPLGNRYYAKRVNVEITDSDDVNSAITGALEGYEYVITTATKSIKAGEQVRLSES